MAGCAAIEWRAGEARWFSPLEPLLHDLVAGRSGPQLEILRDKPGRRRLARAVLPSGDVCFVKLYRGEGRRTHRQVLQRAIGLTTPAREFATLRRLRQAGVAVPEPLAYARLPGGEEVVVTQFLDGHSLTRALERPRRERAALLRAVGELVARLHAAGVVHRDLHRENVWVARDGPTLIDLQAAWRSRLPALRRRDRGELDRSLSPLLSLPDRMRLRAALLGVERPFSPAARRQLRDVGAASHARSLAHATSRAARSLHPGRLYARWRCGVGEGMRLRRADEARLAGALERPGEAELEVLHFAASPARWLPGHRTAARRGWYAGHALRARGIPARRPVAFAEHRGESWLWLEPASGHPAAGAPPASPDEIRALGLALARFGVRHARMRQLPLCRDAAGALCVDALHEVALPRRRSARALRAIDAFVASGIAASAAPSDARRAARCRYLRERHFLPGDGTRRALPRPPAEARTDAEHAHEAHHARTGASRAQGADPAARAPAQPSPPRRTGSREASSPPQQVASRESSSQT